MKNNVNITNERVRQSILAYLRMRGLAGKDGVYPEVYDIIAGRKP